MVESSFSGQKYNANMNTVTHYKVGNHGSKKKKNTTEKKKINSWFRKG